MQRKIKRYKVIDHLEVDLFLKDGWEIYGSPMAAPITRFAQPNGNFVDAEYKQAMVLYEGVENGG